MTTVIDGDSTRHDVTSIDDTDSPYTTTGEQVILADTTGGAVTVTLSTADATADPESTISIIDDGNNAATNNITVNTEGSETMDPGGVASKTIEKDGYGLHAQSNGSNWRTAILGTKNVLNTGTVTLSGGSTPALDTLLPDVLTTETQDYTFTLYVDSDPSFDADYAFNYDYSHQWDDSDSGIDIDLTVNWDTDPGGGNDVTARWEAFA